MLVLWATKRGDEDWQEQLITEQEDKIEQAARWAKENGFDRLRISNINLNERPNFAGTVNL
jgi:DhnA family fructose-bisphosphate aldolase class Ia